MKNFNFDDWRRRYLKWMNNNKSRIMDFFRKQDRDHDGRITREEFIEGILEASKFIHLLQGAMSRFSSRISLNLEPDNY